VVDTGTHEALLQASTFIQTIEERRAHGRLPRGDRLPDGLIAADDVLRTPGR